MNLTLGSLFTGIGGFDLAAERVGINVVWQCEVDAQCRSVLSRHFPLATCIPDVVMARALVEPKNHARIATKLVRPDILCGGFPCQDLSVAGKRSGLAGARSGLWFVFRRIIACVRPSWVFIENVPGLRSSNGGRDLGTILWQLGKLGYRWAYRSLDAQYHGLAQRRERLLIVGSLAGRAHPGQILFDADCLPGNPPPQRTSQPNIAGTIDAGTGVRRGAGINPGAITVASALDCMRGGVDDNSAQANHVVVHTLRAAGFDASEDGTGRGTPLVAHALTACRTASGRMDPSQETYVCGTLQAHSQRHGHAMATQQAAESNQLIPFDTTQITSPGNFSRPREGSPCHPLAAGAHAPAIAFAIQERAESTNPTSGPGGKGYQEGIAFTLEARHRAQSVCQQRRGVRRLTPLECERLQGFPDEWTRWAANDTELSDSSRYRMLGNAVAVPKVQRIFRRIKESHG